MYDWNRVGADGKPRQLHIEEGLGVTDYERGPVASQTPQTIDNNTERLVACDKFVLDRLNVTASFPLGGDNACHIVAVLDGELEIADITIGKGQTILVPACCGTIDVATSSAKLLDMYLP